MSTNNDALREAAKNLVAFHNGPVEGKRPDMFSKLMWRLEEALAASKREPNEADDLLIRLGLDPERYRTDGGYINHMKVRAAILRPESYPRIDQCQHDFVHSADLGGRLCRVCGKPEGVGSKPEPQAQAGEPEDDLTVAYMCGVEAGKDHMREAIAKKDAALKALRVAAIKCAAVIRTRQQKCDDELTSGDVIEAVYALDSVDAAIKQAQEAQR